MSAVALAVILLASGGAGGVMPLRRYAERRRARRALHEHPPLDGSSPEGAIVRVTGIVRAADELIDAPLSGLPCVVARSRIRRVNLGQSKRPSVRPETLRIRPFVLVRDGAPSVRVEASHAVLDLAPLRKLKVTPQRRDQFLLLHALTGIASGFEETLVVPGQRITVAGALLRDAPAEPTGEARGFRDDQAPELVLVGDVAHPIAIGPP